MGIVLKVTPDQLTALSGKISTQISEIENLFDEFGTEVSKTQSYWEGEGSSTHIEKFNGMKGDIQKAIKSLKNHPENLLNMAGLYKETEAAETAASQSLSVDVIV